MKTPATKSAPETPEIDPAAMYWAVFNRFDFRMPGQCVLDCAHSGRCDDDVEHWTPRIRFDENPRRAITPDMIRDELREYGAWDAEELADDAQNLRRLVWIAAGNISDSDSPDCSEPLIPSGEVGPFAQPFI